MPDNVVAENTSAAPADDELIEQAVSLTGALLEQSLGVETRREAARRRRLGNLLADESSMELILALTDEVMRIDQPRRAAHRFASLVQNYGTGAFGPVDSIMLQLAQRLGPIAPRIVMPMVKWRTRAETSGVILSADDPELARHIERRAADGARLNINALGEAILSDAEAQRRLDTVTSQIARDDVNYVSVKLSSVVANLDTAAFSLSVDRVSETLRTIYRTASNHHTFVNLDMEEYRDLELTVEAFKRVLNEPEHEAVDAGIVLQAYLPDSRGAAEDLCSWALQRHRSSGGKIKIRLVKGANLAMERVEAELHGWVPAPFDSKAEVDANFKALLDQLLDHRWASAVRVGLASHNLFDIAWAVVRSRQLGAVDRLEFEMLEGMAPAQARAVQARVGTVLMYSPVVADEDYGSSLAYLSRRLDENTQPDNFLRSLFSLEPNSPEFDRQAEMFRTAVTARTSIDPRRRRALRPATSGFENQPELDFTDPETRSDVASALAGFETPEVSPVETIEGINTIVDIATTGTAAALSTSAFEEIGQWLHRTADLMADEVAETIALLTGETRKTVREAAPEIAEAIDFCRYYGGPGIQNLRRLLTDGHHISGRGVVAVVAPWNFPYAIPTGGVAASLAAGNSVILKPAPQAKVLGARIVEQFHQSGVPTDRLQLAACEDGPVSQSLITHAAVDIVVLTGSHDTAMMFQHWRPDLRVLAETSGKNALVITASADLDLAIADLVRSAFGHAGQKCSAASLGIVTADVYDRPAFLTRVRDAVLSLRTGPASDPATMMGPTISAPDPKLQRGLETLDAGEEWLVRPARWGPHDNQWTPGVRMGVQPGSWFHQTECFGPVLGLIRVEDLDEAIDVQNGTEFGLTGGIHSLDPDEVSTWLDRVEVGNAYVNRVITGAVVQRQPFGGWKKSAFGGGAKAGGPGYVQQLAAIRNPPGADLEAASRSFRDAWEQTFSRDHDPSGLVAESNILRYRPLTKVGVVHDGTDPDSLALLRLAASTAGSQLVECDLGVDSTSDVAGLLAVQPDRVRILCPVSVDTLSQCHDAGVAVDTSPPSSDGFLELYRWVREQSVSTTRHRHGRVPPAAG